jgi:phytanoyl-CoA hydroxylase
MTRSVSDAELDDAVDGWRRDGYARLTEVATGDELEALRSRFVGLTTGALPDPGLFFQADTPTGRYADLTSEHGWVGPDVPYRKVDRLNLDPVFRAWLSQPLFERIVRRIHPGAVMLYRATMFAKAAHTGSETPYHQDGGQLWGLDRTPELQLWTALDDAPPEAGGLEVVTGSHRWGLASPMGGLVPPSAIVERDPTPTPLPARAGDVVLLHNLTWHRSGSNRSPRERRAFTVCYLDGATRCLRKRRAPRVFEQVFDALQPGPL